jgi:hypothetical protein
MFTRIGSPNDVMVGHIRRFDVAGTAIDVANVNGHLCGCDDTCTDRGCSLAKGQLHGTTVECPCHGVRSTVLQSEPECTVAIPYRLDLTVSVLRRLSSNLIDVLTPEGEHLRAPGGMRALVIARVPKLGPATLAVAVRTGERLAADLIVGIGVRPSISLAKDAGLG